MAHEDWNLISRNMFQLLKPGGWLQWVELDLGQAVELLRGDPTIPVSDASQVMHEHLAPICKGFNYCGDNLRGIFHSVGFVNVFREVTSSDRVPQSRKACYFNAERPTRLFWQAEEVQRAARGEATVDVDERMAQIREEVSSGALYQRFDLFTFAGQKPE